MIGSFKDSTMKREHDTAHQQETDQVPPTKGAFPQTLEHPSSENVLVQKTVQTNRKAGCDPQRRAPKSADESPVEGISNEDLWMMLRRFDKASAYLPHLLSIDQIYHVKSIPPPEDFDLYRSEEEVFSPDTLRATIERFYATVVIGLMNFAKHLARLRSWRETRRTALFCAVYFASWLLDLMVPTFSSMLLALLLYPSARELLFPPAPMSLVDSDSGGVQKPKAGVLGSKDTLTGAPENFKGEAVEQEASNLVLGASRLALESAAGKHEQGEPADTTKGMSSSILDPTSIASKSGDAASAARGGIPNEDHDKTREPMMEIMQQKAMQMMGVIGDISDTYERFSNALSPKPPFTSSWPRIRIAVLCTLAAATLLIPSYILIKMSTFFVGIGLFGGPIITPAVKILDHFDIRRTILQANPILRGVPTNAQLTLTLLRIGEAKGDPLPPPPVSLEPKTSESLSITEEELPLGSSDKEIQSALTRESSEHERDSQINTKPEKKRWASSIVSFFRGVTAAGVETERTLDRTKAAMGSSAAKKRLGMLRKKLQFPQPGSITTFEARFEGQKGAMVIPAVPFSSSEDPPLLYFTTEPGWQYEDLTAEEGKEKRRVLFSIPINEIKELKKTSGMGWKGKLVVGWCEPNKEVIDGLVVIGSSPDQQYQLTAITRRNALFNRLIAMTGTFWESC
ncbi:hypothetical protein ACJ72_06606 [Emergomyces africanus]|uniref:Uncharacterized protein n=1 Tax=Emergomyces africanus TaxID=1955775 RepID=A0A1B7NQM5_9EURO|nr:hypothetical protein ACJ72_06606 [Emergomyces africanus]